MMTKPLMNFDEYTAAVQDAMNSVDKTSVEVVISTLQQTFFDSKNVFVCGNGGSAAIADHLTCDCMKGVAMDRGTGISLKVTSLSCNGPLITALANDIGYEHVFSKQVLWQGTPGDILIVISSSGNSPNIIEAINSAHERSMTTIAITGFDGGKAAELADHSIHIESNNYGVIEDVSQSIMHYIAQSLRRNLAILKRPEDIKY
jgi:D-sedoheptulose 7-phosphate isomerase